MTVAADGRAGAGDDPDDLGDRTARAVPWVAASAILSRLFLAAVILVLAAHLSVHDLGVLAVPVTLSTMLITLNDLGFGQAVVAQRGHVAEAVATATLVSLAIGVSMMGVLLLASTAISTFLHVPEAAPLIRAYAPLIALDAYVTVPLMRLNRELSFKKRFMVETVPLTVGALLTIVLAFAGVGVWSLVLGDSARFLLVFAVVLVVPAIRTWPRWHGDVLGGMWRFAAAATAALGFDIVLLNIDYFLVARLLGPTALGYYSLAFRIAIVPFFVVTMVVVGAAWPALARLAHERERLHAAFRFSFRVGMVAVLVLAGGIVITAPWIEVLGDRWAAAVPTLRLLAIFVVLRSAAYLIEPYFLATRRPGINAILRACWVLALVLAIVAVAHAGVVAVAAAQVGVACILLAVHLIALARLKEIPVGRSMRDVTAPILAVAVACLVVLGGQAATGWTLNHGSWRDLIVVGTTYIVVVVPLLIWWAPSIVRDVNEFRRRSWRREAGSRMRASTIAEPMASSEPSGL